MMVYRRPRGRQRSRVAILAAVMLLGTGVPQPDVFAQGGSVWVDPPPLESTGKPASPTTPEVRTPAGAKASIPPVAELTTPEAQAPAGPKASIPRVAEPLNSEPARPRLSRPRAIAAPAARKPEPSRRAELNRPKSQQGPSAPRVTERLPILNPAPVRPRMSRPTAVETESAARPARLSRPKPQEEPAARARRVPAPAEEIVVEIAPPPRRSGQHAGSAMPRPSFSCRYAKSSVEHAICADPVLAAKDRRMALLYERAGGSRYGPVDPSQWGWVAARNRCGRVHDEALERCLHRAYDDRVAELSLQ